MPEAILFSAALALLLGGASGFRRWWKKSLLLSTLVIPFSASIVGVARFEGVFSLEWLLLTFVWAFLLASLAWGMAAGAHHAVYRVYCRLTSR